MSGKRQTRPADVAVAIFVAAAIALGFAMVLAAVASPPHFEAREALLLRQVARARELMKPARDEAAVAALCRGDPSRQAQALHDLILAETGRAALTVDALDARIEPAPEVSTQVMPVRVRFSATGSYESAVGLLAELARERPQLFVDSLDLTPKVSNVTLSLSGRVFCGA